MAESSGTAGMGNPGVGEEAPQTTDSSGKDVLQPALQRSDETVGHGNEEDGTVSVVSSSVGVDSPEEGLHDPEPQFPEGSAGS